MSGSTASNHLLQHSHRRQNDPYHKDTLKAAYHASALAISNLWVEPGKSP